MKFSDEVLLAYAEGNLDQPTRAALEQAMRADVTLARRLARLRATGPEPSRPAPAGTAGGRAKVVQLAAVRASRAAQPGALRRPRRRWLEWGALLLALLLGVVLGKFGLARWDIGGGGGGDGDGQENAAVLASHDGQLVARGRLARALDQQLGGAAVVEGDVRIGLSFVAREGAYCRSFTLAGTGLDLSALACRSGAEWRVPVLMQSTRPLPQMGQRRLGSASLPGPIYDAIDQRLVGAVLDPRAELEAIRRDWRR